MTCGRGIGSSCTLRTNRDTRGSCIKEIHEKYSRRPERISGLEQTAKVRLGVRQTYVQAPAVSEYVPALQLLHADTSLAPATDINILLDILLGLSDITVSSGLMQGVEIRFEICSKI